ncbi:hypothetical protein HY490_05195 [Candidatus Woesearchaeota archaeon]|nr:hypothetical protein [Candidatus Woesearchaeota archaeon]
MRLKAELGKFDAQPLKSLQSLINEDRMVEKKAKKKDPYEEIIEMLEQYEEGTPPRTDVSDWGE